MHKDIFRSSVKGARVLKNIYVAMIASVFGLLAMGWTQGARAEDLTALSSAAQAAIQQLGSEDAYVRQKAFLQLEALRELAALPSIRSYIDDKDVDMRAWSLRAIAAIQGLDAIPLLRERAQKDKKPVVRRAAILGLEPFLEKDESLAPFMIQMLRDRNPEVRMTAADIVSRINEPKAHEALRKQAKRENNRDARKVFKMALARISSS